MAAGLNHQGRSGGKMRYYLENSSIKAEFDSFGAELKSVVNKHNNREYMWYANPAVWARTSPVLFPLVGTLRDGKYRYDGKEYFMSSHGFARDMEHKMISQSMDEIWFELTDTDKTLEMFPFHFRFCIGYKLTGTELKVMWKVYNTDNKEMFFSLGAHPAFLCPVHGESDKEGYYLKFDKGGDIHHYGNRHGVCMHEDVVLKTEDNKAYITKDFFDRTTYMIEGTDIKEVSILDRDENPVVKVSFDTPIFAIWSPAGINAPFICIEPWYGRSDYEDFEGELSERDFIEKLEEGGSFEREYSIIFYEV